MTVHRKSPRFSLKRKAKPLGEMVRLQESALTVRMNFPPFFFSPRRHSKQLKTIGSYHPPPPIPPHSVIMIIPLRLSQPSSSVSTSMSPAIDCKVRRLIRGQRSCATPVSNAVRHRLDSYRPWLCRPSSVWRASRFNVSCAAKKAGKKTHHSLKLNA